MKTSECIKCLYRLVMLLFTIVVITACEKTKETQTFYDVFDLSGVEALNEKIFNAKTSDDLEKLLEIDQINVPEFFRNVDFGQMIAHFEKSIILSDDEMDMLLKNDSRTYIEFINRFGSMPAQLKDLKISDFEDLKKSSLNQYMLKVKEEPFNFYSNDYYSAVIAMQDFIKYSVIQPLNHMNNSKFKTRPPGLGEYPEDPEYVLFYKLIASNRIWDIWWAYWSDGTRTKHKGSAGSFPG